MKRLMQLMFFFIMLIGSTISLLASSTIMSNFYLQLIAYTSPYLFFISSIIYFFRKRRKQALVYLIIVLMNSVSITDLISINLNSTEEGIKILSLNAAQLKYVKDINVFAAEINQYQPDIICLQEIGIRENWQNKDKITQQLAALFNLPYYSFDREHNNIYGLAIFSKYPIIDSSIIFLPISKMNGAVKYQLSINGKPIDIINVHLSSYNLPNIKVNNYELDKIYLQQCEEIQQINYTLNKKTPTIITGDFNSPSYAYNYNLLKDAGLKDGFNASNFNIGGTLSNPLLLWRIDGQLYYNLTYNNYKNIFTSQSDHHIQLGYFNVSSI